MDKLAYHFNKKKKPAKTEGKFLYYYPCEAEDNPNAWYGDKAFIVLEVTESEWEALFELDRLEYNNTRKYQRHTKAINEQPEELLKPEVQECRLDREIPFYVLSDNKIDFNIMLGQFPKRDRKILKVMDKCDTQKEAAEKLGVTQGYVSVALKKANQLVDDYIFETATHDEIVKHCWDMFVDKGEMPDFLDVELEFVLRGLFYDLPQFFHWYYSLGELCRYVLHCYLFDNDKADDEIAEYLNTASAEDKIHFTEYYGEQPPIVGLVYVRLCREMKCRQTAGLHDSDKLYNGIFATIDMLARRLKTTPYDFLTQRFYPYFAKRRNKRLKAFYKAYSGKKLPD